MFKSFVGKNQKVCSKTQWAGYPHRQNPNLGFWENPPYYGTSNYRCENEKGHLHATQTAWETQPTLTVTVDSDSC